MNIKYAKTLLILGCSLIAVMPVAHAENIESAMQQALQHHPSAEAAQAFLQSSAQDRRSEFSGYFPRVSINGTGGRLYGDNSTSRGLSVTRGAGYSYLWEGTAALSQPIFDGFGTISRVSAARARENAASMDLLDVRENLALRAAQSYINVMRTHAALDMLKKHRKKVDDYLGRIKSSVDQGAADEAEYQQARDVGVMLEGFITDYEGQAKMAEAAYLEAMGRLPEGQMDVPAPALNLIPAEVDQAVSLALETHPSLKSAVYAAEAAHAGIRAEKSSLYPGLDGEVSYFKSDKADIIGGEAVDARAVLRLNWELETGAGQLARVQKRKYELSEAEARARETERQIEGAVRQSYAELEASKGQLSHQKERLGLNKKLFDTYTAQFEGARITLLQLMQADNQLFNVELEKLNTEYRVLVAQYTVLASLGTLQKSINLAAVDDDRN